MDNAHAILYVLGSDLRLLGELTFLMVALSLVPALVTGFVAAARTEPTMWRDVPIGFLVGWGAGSAVAIVLVLIGLGTYAIAEQSLPRSLKPALDWATFGYGVLTVPACLVVQYRTAARYFRWEIKKRLGWQIEDLPPQPANRWYSFSLRNLLLVQLAVVAGFGLWVSSRRAHIRSQYEQLQTRAWQADLQERLGGHGWELQHKMVPLRLYCWGQPLIDFNDEVLDKILLTDRLQHLEVVSDGLTDEGLKKLVSHQELQTLTVSSRHLTDAGIAHLKRLPKLERVVLTAPQLTDQSLEELQTIASLGNVRIHSNTTITREAVARFKDARPDVEIWVVSWK